MVDDGREALGPADGDAIAALLGAEEGAGSLLGSNDGKAEGSNMLGPDDGDDDLLGSDEEVGTLVGTEDLLGSKDARGFELDDGADVGSEAN